ncbi:MAG: GNAT family N-acetyltransferase [Bacteroidota bacterium]
MKGAQSGNELSVSKADLADVDESYEIIRQCRDQLSQQGMDNWSRYTREKVEQIIKSGDMYLLKNGKELVGTVKVSAGAPSFYSNEDLEKWEDPEAEAFYFTALAVSPMHQGMGYGSVLLDYVEDHARKHEVPYLRMTMFARNLPLARYYIRKGFTFPQTRKVAALGLELSFGEKRLKPIT